MIDRLNAHPLFLRSGKMKRFYDSLVLKNYVKKFSSMNRQATILALIRLEWIRTKPR